MDLRTRTDSVEVEQSPGAMRGARVRVALNHRTAVLTSALEALAARESRIAEVAGLLVQTLRSGHKVLAAGNGGSAAEAQHFVAELVGRFKRERAPYAALALCTDSAIVTAIANDYGYEQVFARQVLALGRPEDLFIAFSTSGESENIVQAAAVANSRGMRTVAITGNRPSRLQRLSHLSVVIPVQETELIQELHMVVTHLLCDIAETELTADETER